MRETWSATSSAVSVVLFISGSMTVMAQISQETLDSISMPDKIQTRIGTLEFRDGAPSAEIAAAA
jgi:hypothetical protein